MRPQLVLLATPSRFILVPAACSTSSGGGNGSGGSDEGGANSSSGGSSGGGNHIKNIFIVLMENHNWSDIYQSSWSCPCKNKQVVS